MPCLDMGEFMEVPHEMHLSATLRFLHTPFYDNDTDTVSAATYKNVQKYFEHIFEGSAVVNLVSLSCLVRVVFGVRRKMACHVFGWLPIVIVRYFEEFVIG